MTTSTASDSIEITQASVQQVTCVQHGFMNAQTELAHAFRVFILGRMEPDNYAKNAVKAAQTLICDRFTDGSAFPMVVKIDDDLYVIPWMYGVAGGIGEDSPYLDAVKKVCTAYAGETQVS